VVLFNSLVADEQDTVRVLALSSCLNLANILSAEDRAAIILPAVTRTPPNPPSVTITSTTAIFPHFSHLG